MNNEELNKILKNHKHWIKEDCDGWQDMKANLCGADLHEADLRGAYLCGADLHEADLRGAYLFEANLRGADLRGADLRGADLFGANLCGADLHEADLFEANLFGANLCGADPREAKNIPYIPMACPDTGAFIGWKKCRAHGKNNGYLIVKLLIPEDAKRSSATGRKCRCGKAVVLEVQDMDGNKVDKTAYATARGHEYFEYKAGETVIPEQPFCEDRFDECSSGIHFFINRQEAVEY